MSPRPAPAAASATFGKPKDKAPAAAPIAAKPAAAPAPKPVAVAAPAPIKPAAVAPPASPKPAAVAPPASPKPAAPPPPKPTAPSPSAGIDDAKMRALYSRYVDARKQNNERADVRYETLAESVGKMMPKLREKHGNKAIDFEVVVSNGKVGLKPKVGP